MITITDVSKNFGNKKILDGISFSVCPGEIYGLIGYNGVGKTTLMRMISGIYRPDTGTIMLDGRQIYENPDVKRQCFFMTEEPPFFEQSTMEKMSRFYRGYYPLWSEKTFYGLADWFGLDINAKVSSFSKGMQRQASIAAAFSSGAQVLLLDEAFDGLDAAIRKSLGSMLRFYAAEKNVILIISSHNLNELEGIADKVGLIDNGKLIFDDSVGVIHEQYGMNLEEFFCRERNINAADWKEIFE